ncbi:MAG: hypothetical protein SVW02_01640 [Candidatus Nanohaloarchaea archaeon]|nr:hypothetical protein [Candidatus Nanohaloarchaea archaeon]
MASEQVVDTEDDAVIPEFTDEELENQVDREIELFREALRKLPRG